jgi:hypothetical protein
VRERSARPELLPVCFNSRRRQRPSVDLAAGQRIVEAAVLLAWRNRQTRTAQDRMGKPVEVRVLSRAIASLDYK